MQGEGAGEAQIHVLRDGKDPEVAHSLPVEGGPGARWTNVDLSLEEFGTGPLAIELVASEAPKGGRILFGDPEVVISTPPPPSVPAARAVVVVVLDGVERRELPPWGGDALPNLPALSDLSATSTTFQHHRAPSTVISSVFASLLTANHPGVHGLTDASARLPASQTTMAAVARDASVRTAMFTGVPHTFRAFGFNAGWERFVEHAPTSGDPATAPLDGAATWITEIAKTSEKTRMLVVVHARGAHPPWDVPQHALATVPPKDYTGLIEPRRSAQILAKLRRRRAREVLNEADRLRIRSFAAIGMAGQDRALGALVTALKAANLWDGTLFIVTGSVASGISDQALFADGLDLKEPWLTLPLYVHFPGGLYAGRKVEAASEIFDIPKTALAALGLSFATKTSGRDLAQIASELAETGEPQIATLGGKYSARWGDVVLTGRFSRAPDLCDLSLDATCAFNRREVMPISTAAIFQRVVASPAMNAAPEKREPATLDTDLMSYLNVWGASE
jgi:arylsulfatase A-like enzyme